MLRIAYTLNGIKWNKVTWYSKLGAIILCFGILPALSFYIGVQYEQTRVALNEAAIVVPGY